MVIDVEKPINDWVSVKVKSTVKDSLLTVVKDQYIKNNPRMADHNITISELVNALIEHYIEDNKNTLVKVVK